MDAEDEGAAASDLDEQDDHEQGKKHKSPLEYIDPFSAYQNNPIEDEIESVGSADENFEDEIEKVKRRAKMNYPDVSRAQAPPMREEPRREEVKRSFADLKPPVSPPQHQPGPQTRPNAQFHHPPISHKIPQQNYPDFQSCNIGTSNSIRNNGMARSEEVSKTDMGPFFDDDFGIDDEMPDFDHIDAIEKAVIEKTRNKSSIMTPPSLSNGFSPPKAGNTEKFRSNAPNMMKGFDIPAQRQKPNPSFDANEKRIKKNGYDPGFGKEEERTGLVGGSLNNNGFPPNPPTVQNPIYENPFGPSSLTSSQRNSFVPEAPLNQMPFGNNLRPAIPPNQTPFSAPPIEAFQIPEEQPESEFVDPFEGEENITSWENPVESNSGFNPEAPQNSCIANGSQSIFTGPQNNSYLNPPQNTWNHSFYHSNLPQTNQPHFQGQNGHFGGVSQQNGHGLVSQTISSNQSSFETNRLTQTKPPTTSFALNHFHGGLNQENSLGSDLASQFYYRQQPSFNLNSGNNGMGYQTTVHSWNKKSNGNMAQTQKNFGSQHQNQNQFQHQNQIKPNPSLPGTKMREETGRNWNRNAGMNPK